MVTLLEEFSEIIEALQSHDIRYALVGGFAVAVHGGVRAIKDIDFLVHPEDFVLVVMKNARKFYTDLADIAFLIGEGAIDDQG